MNRTRLWAGFLAASTMLVSGYAGAYAEKPTHEHLTRFAILLLEGDGCVDEVKLYQQVLEDATVAEDEGARCTHHFYDPTTHLGLPTNTLTRAYAAYNSRTKPLPDFIDGTRYTNAVIWARDGMPDRLGWEAAIDAYGDPALGEKGHETAWRALGHVLHLEQDMCQPDHARDRPHPGNYMSKAFIYTDHPLSPRYGYESLWGKLGDQWPHGTKVRDLDSLEKAFDAAATLSQTTETSLGVPLEHEYALGLGDVVGTRAGGSAAFSQSVRDHSAGIVTDALWTEFEIHLPVQPMITLDPPNSRAKVYTELGKTMLTAAEEFTAGLIRLFYRIVKPPPIVESVTLTQEGESAPQYRATWESGASRRTLKVEGSGELVSGKKTRVRIQFGPSLTLKGTTFKEQIGHPGVSLEIAGKPAVSVDEDALLIADGIWEGHFFATEPGTLVVQANDLDIHFTRRNSPGAELDSDPATIARAGAKSPYDWKDYTPGADRNHSFKIEAGCPASVVSAELRKRSEWGEVTGTYEVKKTYADGVRDPQNVADPSWEWSGSWTETVRFRARIHWEPGAHDAEIGHLVAGTDEETSAGGNRRAGRVKEVSGRLTLDGPQSGKYVVRLERELESVATSRDSDETKKHGTIFPQVKPGEIDGRACSDSTLRGGHRDTIGKPEFIEKRSASQFSLTSTMPRAEKHYETADWSWNLSIVPIPRPPHADLCAKDFSTQRRESTAAAFDRALLQTASPALGLLYKAGRANAADALAPVLRASPEQQSAMAAMSEDANAVQRACPALGEAWISSEPASETTYQAQLKTLQENVTSFERHDRAAAEALATRAETAATALQSVDAAGAAALRKLAADARAK